MPLSSMERGLMGRLQSAWYWLIMVRIFSFVDSMVSMAFSSGDKVVWRRGGRGIEEGETNEGRGKGCKGVTMDGFQSESQEVSNEKFNNGKNEKELNQWRGTLYTRDNISQQTYESNMGWNLTHTDLHVSCQLPRTSAGSRAAYTRWWRLYVQSTWTKTKRGDKK